MIQPFTSNHGQQNVAGAIFVDDSNRPFLFMIDVRYARQWFKALPHVTISSTISSTMRALTLSPQR